MRAAVIDGTAGRPLEIRAEHVAAARRKVAQRTAAAGGDGGSLGGRALVEITGPFIGGRARDWAMDTVTEDQPRRWAKSGGHTVVESA